MTGEEISEMSSCSTAGAVPEDRYAGTRTLWLKVIVRAIFDWVTYRDRTTLSERRLADSAYTWLFKPSHLFNGFESVCEYLNLDPDTVRQRARRVTREDVAKIEHLERTCNPKCYLGQICGELPESSQDSDEVC